MSDWSQGYFSDITYTYGYYKELSPQRFIIPFLMAGIAPPKIMNACELGFGQGVSINIHAAAGQAKWYGTDFNPSHVAFAQSLNQASGAESLLVDQAFDEFCLREDLPDFDFIALHGIWSWISDENRQIIVDFIRRKLKVGGVLYISYNTLPGWSAASPIRHLISEHYHTTQSSNHSAVENISTTLNSVEEIFKQCGVLLDNNPKILERLSYLNDQNKNYVAHEYLNQNWDPSYFSEIESTLSAAKISYACSTNYLNDFTDCLFNAEQYQIISNIQNESFAQTVKDFLLNTQFRKDLWVKGKYPFHEEHLKNYWFEQRVMLVSERKNVSLNAAHIRSTNLKEEIFNPLLDLLTDNKIHRVSELAKKLDFSETILFKALAILCAKEDVVLVQPDEVIAQAKPRCEALNRHILEQAKTKTNLQYLASPVIGTGIAYSNTEQMFLLAHIMGKPQSEWCKFVWNTLQAKNLKIVKDGKTLATAEENLAEIQEHKTRFLAHTFKMAKRLQIIS